MYIITRRSNATVYRSTTVRRVSGKRIASSAKGGDMAMRGHIEGHRPMQRGGRIGPGTSTCTCIRSAVVCCVLPRRFRALDRSRSVATRDSDCQIGNSVYKYYTNVLGCGVGSLRLLRVGGWLQLQSCRGCPLPTHLVCSPLSPSSDDRC